MLLIRLVQVMYGNVTSHAPHRTICAWLDRWATWPWSHFWHSNPPRPAVADLARSGTWKHHAKPCLQVGRGAKIVPAWNWRKPVVAKFKNVNEQYLTDFHCKPSGQAASWQSCGRRPRCPHRTKLSDIPRALASAPDDPRRFRHVKRPPKKSAPGPRHRQTSPTKPEPGSSRSIPKSAAHPSPY